MVFRKPYAFLIKNFKKIHILLLFLWGFSYYKIYGVRKFIKDYITYGVYSRNLEGISTKIGPLLYLAMVLIIIISILLLLLLLYKKKPWKLYLIIIGEYIFMMYSCISITSYFNSYTVSTTVSSVFIYRDIINIASLLQYLVLIILLLRITGLDLKKFSFNSDQEFLELSSSDREEFEISIEIDKHSFKRKYNLLKRNLRYFYEEHKTICNMFFVVMVISLVSYTWYYFGVKNKSYKVGETFSAGIYDIKINDVYVTDKTATGNVIEKNSKFVIMKVTMKNNDSETVEPNFGRFHLMNRDINRINTIYYDNDFKDIGKGISSDNSIKSGEEKTFMLVFKVNEKLENKRFVLYYQEYNGRNNTYLRKIKLNLKDISKVNETKNYQLNDKVAFETLDGNTNEVVFDDVYFGDSVTYSKYECTALKCGFEQKILVPFGDYKILKISFASSDYEGKEFIDFTSRYAIIKYVDSNGKTLNFSIEDALGIEYEGKDLFIKVTNDIINSGEVYIDYIVRNKEYMIKIK
ncbi:MAG: DUF4352 domain-containing protein [Bacilli bacterium]|nr:DUF4352 domain-containing protein [Bacilli bacterium]